MNNCRCGKEVSCPPVVVELFSQHQQRGCFSERFVFAAQFALKFMDTFLVFVRLLPIFFLLSLLRLLAGDEGLPPSRDLLGVKAFTTAILAQVDLGQAGRFENDSKFGFGWSALGR